MAHWSIEVGPASAEDVVDAILAAEDASEGVVDQIASAKAAAEAIIDGLEPDAPEGALFTVNAGGFAAPDVDHPDPAVSVSVDVVTPVGSAQQPQPE